ncbi:hypothetical protein Q4R84_01995 [Morganella morganii]|uniref:hypothetical protein n=1 Tax=Morganella morganii TaxID=582 RepID=UPI001BA0BA83|nr:hypothetical protein [Morganella morganii]ELB3891381.1 hypothetical protein [Morganella morganii]HBC7442402.1 hypothetical protein [Morganella morganii]HCT1426707.1 hypothetical protein [Morganella morganii]HCU0874336.1 hypothetical protein [Morganella morganii]
MGKLRINQIGLVSAISIEIANQHNGIKISQSQLNAIIQAANSVVAAFDEPNLCSSCNDWPRGGCLPTCTAYDKGNRHA